MSKDRVYYVRTNDALPTHAFSRLMEAIQQSKQDKAQASQWMGWIKGLTQKGVKQSEIEDVDLLTWLDERNLEDPKRKLTRQDLLDRIKQIAPTIKVVDLANHQYASFQSLAGGEYVERLYILSSESMLIDDKIEDIIYRIQDLGFDPSPLMEDPLLIDRLENEVHALNKEKLRAWDFKNHHFSESIKAHGKNLMAHARITIKDGTFFVQEIQSDWAQRGRRKGWTMGYPKAPFVTKTEQWAGLVVNDLLQTAAKRQDIQRVAWVRSDMRNGWDREIDDNMAEFYDNIVRKIVEKRISKTDAKVQTFDLINKRNTVDQVMGIEMTGQARAALVDAYPLYSRDKVVARPRDWMDEAYEADIRARVMKECNLMLGSAHMVRFFNRLYDVSSGSEVPGRYIKDTIELSWRAQDPIRVARHECMHFAYDHMLLPHERWVLDEAFAPGSEMNIRTQELLLSRGLKDAARESRDSAQECAAYAFEYWARGEMDVREKVEGVFGGVVQVLKEIGSWVRKFINPQEKQTADEIFESLSTGVIAARHRIEQELEYIDRAQQAQVDC